MAATPGLAVASTTAMAAAVSRPVAKICPLGLVSQTIYEILVVAIGGSLLGRESREMGHVGQVAGRRPDACAAVV